MAGEKKIKRLGFPFSHLKAKIQQLALLDLREMIFSKKNFNEAWEEANKDLFSVNT